MPQLLSRLFILGDPHIAQPDMDLWQEAIEDINALSPPPSAVLVLGDLTGSDVTGTTGSPESNRQAVRVLNQMRYPWRSIIGNHDLEWKGHSSDEAAVGDFLEATGQETPWFRWDLPDFTILGLSNTWHHRSEINKNEIIIDDAQLDWFQSQLKALHQTPVVLAVHAPPLGSGVIALSESHLSGGNGITNQNHLPHQLLQIIKQHGNVLFCFSGHIHMGQHYRDALSLKLGVHFIHTGVVGRHTRDGRRHSRVLDLYDDHFEILTYDHSLRRFDPSLTYRSSHTLQDWFNYRVNHVGQNMIACDPQTMQHRPPAGPVMAGQVQFAIFSDMHVVDPVQPVQRRCLEWAAQQATDDGATAALFNGDVSHHDSAAEVMLGLNRMPVHHMVRHLIPGNNEGLPMPDGLRESHRLRLYSQDVARLEGFPGQAWALGTTSRDDIAPTVAKLASQLPDAGQVLIVTHFAPLAANDSSLQPLLDKPGLRVHWFSGHEHSVITRTHANISIHVVAGLDPMKVRDTLPEIVLGKWTGQSLTFERRTVPLHVLRPSRSQQHQVGIAYLGSPAHHLDDALAHDIQAIQFRDVHKFDEPVHDRIDAWRKKFPQGRLSIHLPVPGKDENGPDMTRLAPHIQWAIEHGIDDWTLHMPSVDAPLLYSSDRQFQSTPWAMNCLERYKALARQAIEAHAQLSIENVNNNEKVPSEKELLSCRPWHVTKFIEKLRELLLADGLSQDQVQKVGMIFDAGHAFTDPVVSKEHGLSDWVEQTAAYIQMAHIHQAIRPDGEGSAYKRHREITTPAGRMINHLGLMALLMEKLPRPIVLLAEVRDRKEALTSVRTLQAIIEGFRS